VKFDPRLLRAARPREILVRMLQNLRSLYEERKDMPRALSAVDRLLLLAPTTSAACASGRSSTSIWAGRPRRRRTWKRCFSSSRRLRRAALRARVRRLRDSSQFLN